MQAKAKKRTVKIWQAAVISLLALVIIGLAVLVVLEASGVLYRRPSEEITITPPKKANGEIMTEGDYNYALLTDGTVMITTAFVGKKAPITLEIPQTLGGYTVSAIGESSFALSLTDTKSVIIPEGVRYIGRMAFFGADNASLYLPSSVEQIDMQALYGFDNPLSIVYNGTSEQWEKVKIGKGNAVLGAVTFSQ